MARLKRRDNAPNDDVYPCCGGREDRESLASIVGVLGLDAAVKGGNAALLRNPCGHIRADIEREQQWAQTDKPSAVMAAWPNPPDQTIGPIVTPALSEDVTEMDDYR